MFVRRSTTTVALFFTLLTSASAIAAVSNKTDIHTTHLRCDYLPEPLGIDDLHPRLSWQMKSGRPGAAQTAYQISVASTPELLKQNHPDMWDSGRVASDVSVDLPYTGAPLQPSKRYFWSVRVWDERGKSVAPSQSSWWETGLLQSSNWKAQWISSDTTEDREDRASAPKWIWTNGEDALKHPKPGNHQFRFSFDLTHRPIDATLFITGKDTVSAAINGKQILDAAPPPPWGALYTWGTFRKLSVTANLREGKNVLAAETNVVGPDQNGSAGLIALLRLKMPDGRVIRYISDASWRSTDTAKGNWRALDYDDASWKPATVAAQLGDDPLGTPWPPKPASLFRRTFQLDKSIKSARLYVTALGSYQMRINGTAVGKDVLDPGWTDYKAKLFYQTYDVTSSLHKGENVIGALLGDGWYGSGLVFFQQRFNFGPPPLRLLAQVDIEFTDGSRQTLISDPSWQTSPSAIRTSDIYNGENFDARDEQPGWDKPGFHPVSSWREATVGEAPPAQIVAQNFQPIEVEQQLTAKAVTNPSPGVYLFDMGQNMVGTERLRVTGPAGAVVRLRFGEMLQPNGQLYWENMRTAAETDTYTLRGSGEEVFIPHFTYHGYRYIEVTGYPGKPTQDAVTGIVFHTDAPFTVKFDSGSPIINKLWSNILWGQRGNFMSIPTDCPQRDERLGWMGDAQVFWRTASYNMNLAAFSEKFTSDIDIAQSAKGNYSDITPRVGVVVGDGSPGWADAGIIIPYVASQQYGDTRIIEESWDSMDRYLGLLLKENPDLITHRVAYGDWLAIGSTTPQDLISTAYWAYDAQLMSRMAKAIHRPEDAARYDKLFESIKAVFQQHFVHANGSVGSDSQTSYVLALHMNLVPEDQRQAVAAKLVADIQAHGHLTTGFLGTPYIMSVLSSTGHSDTAYKLLLTNTFPSWGYMVEHGATTMWERWNGDQMLGDPGMNSFNHYAYGSVAEWLYRYVAGIDIGPDDHAFHHFNLHPQCDARLGHGAATYESTYGTITSDWKYINGTVDWTATIPANTSATLTIPASATDGLLLNGKPLTTQSPGLTPVASPEHKQVFEAKPGTYHFTIHAADSGATMARAQ
jgi:alpha-L-rhamnosidase